MDFIEPPSRYAKWRQRDNDEIRVFVRNRLVWIIKQRYRTLGRNNGKDVYLEELEYFVPTYKDAVTEEGADLTPLLVEAGIEQNFWSLMLGDVKYMVDLLAPKYKLTPDDFWKHRGGDYNATEIGLALIMECNDWRDKEYGLLEQEWEAKLITERTVRHLMASAYSVRDLPSMWRQDIAVRWKEPRRDILAIMDMIPPLVAHNTFKHFSIYWRPGEASLFRQLLLDRIPIHRVTGNRNLRSQTGLYDKRKRVFEKFMKDLLKEDPPDYLLRGRPGQNSVKLEMLKIFAGCSESGNL